MKNVESYFKVTKDIICSYGIARAIAMGAKVLGTYRLLQTMDDPIPDKGKRRSQQRALKYSFQCIRYKRHSRPWYTSKVQWEAWLLWLSIGYLISKNHLKNLSEILILGFVTIFVWENEMGVIIQAKAVGTNSALILNLPSLSN